MNRIDPTLETTNILSLLAITVGAVSAAVIIMFAGLLVTLFSMDSNSIRHWQVAMGTATIFPGTDVIRATAHAHPDIKKMQGQFMDALLREPSLRLSPALAGGLTSATIRAHYTVTVNAATRAARVYVSPIIYYV